MVHRCEIDGRDILFGNHGALLGSAMTWWDHETGSIWSQPLGEAVAGPHKGKKLSLLPSQLTSWGTWRAQHPTTLALDAPGHPSSFELDTMNIVMEIGDEGAAYAVDTVRKLGVVNDVVAGVPVAVVVDQRTRDQWAVFARTVEERVLRLELRDGALEEADTGSRWHAGTGVGIDGPLAAVSLPRIPAFTSFPSDFDTFWPEGRPGGQVSTGVVTAGAGYTTGEDPPSTLIAVPVTNDARGEARNTTTSATSSASPMRPSNTFSPTSPQNCSSE